MPEIHSSPDPSAILQTAFAFWSSKVLLTAVEMDVFTRLGRERLTGAELGAQLGLHPRGISDFFDALVAMKFLEREGSGPNARYVNTPAGALYLDRKSPRYIGGIMEMLNARLFRFWHDLPEALRTGKPQNEIKHSQKPMFEELYSDLPRLEQFMGAMTGLSRLNFEAFAERFDCTPFRTHCDVGGATGLLSIEVAKRHPHIRGISFDLPAVDWSTTQRSSGNLWLSEVVATIGLLLVIHGCVRTGRASAVPFAVGVWIGGAYWFTSSTSFANPAVTIARTLSDTFAGIKPSSAPMFIVMQLIGAVLAFVLIRYLYQAKGAR